MPVCVRCNTNQNLISHDFTYDILPVLSKHIYNFSSRELRESSQSIPIPVCRNCKKLFDKWNLIENLLYGIGTLEFISSLIFGLGFIFSIFWGAPYISIFQIDVGFISPLTILFIFSIIFPFFLIDIIWILAHKHKNTNPRNYIRIGTGGVPFVRPQSYPAWIYYYDWLNALKPAPVLSNKIIEKQTNPNLKFEKLILKILNSNSGKAFTNRAILNRIVEQLSEATEREYIDTNCDQILNDMNLKGILKVVVKQDELYYVIV